MLNIEIFIQQAHNNR